MGKSDIYLCSNYPITVVPFIFMAAVVQIYMYTTCIQYICIYMYMCRSIAIMRGSEEALADPLSLPFLGL